MELGVSVIVCSFNGAERIPDVLHHLANQVFHDQTIPWEVILVDNASTDNTREVALNSWKGDPEKFRVIRENRPGLSYARMFGIANSRYEYLSFVDDDNWVENNWIEEVFNILHTYNNVGMCGGLGEAVIEGTPPYWFARYQDAFAVGPQASQEGLMLDPDRVYLHGAGLCIKKTVFNELIERKFSFILSGRKGKKLSSGEDSELSYAVRLIGYDLYYNPNLKFKHIMSQNRLTFSYLTRLSSAFGRAYVVIELYRAVLFSVPSSKPVFTYNPYLSIILSVKNLLKTIAFYCFDYIFKRENKDNDILMVHFLMNSITEKFRLLNKYPEIIKSIIHLKQNSCSKI